MRSILYIIMYLVDYFHKKKIKKFLKSTIKDKKIVVIDVGAHHGETIKFFLENFRIKKIFSYEASKENFEILKRKFVANQINLLIKNFGIGEKEGSLLLNQVNESSSSTFCAIDQNSSYYKKKNRLLNFFFF